MVFDPSCLSLRRQVGRMIGWTVFSIFATSLVHASNLLLLEHERLVVECDTCHARRDLTREDHACTLGSYFSRTWNDYENILRPAARWRLGTGICMAGAGWTAGAIATLRHARRRAVRRTTGLLVRGVRFRRSQNLTEANWEDDPNCYAT